MKASYLIAALVFVMALSLTASAFAQKVVVHDQTFLTTQWDLVFAGGQNAYSASASRSSGAGVTSDARITSISGATPMQYDVRHYYTGFNWTPATMGQMTDVSFELWYKFQNASSSSITRLVARQSGFEFVAPSTYREPQNSSSFWQRHSGSFNVSEFTCLSSTGPATLDFSSAAPPIQIGYELFSNVNLPGSVTVQNSFFDVQIQRIAPSAADEPTTFTLAICGGCVVLGLGVCKRNKARVCKYSLRFAMRV